MKRAQLLAALAVCSVGAACAVNMPPYEVYPYLADQTDDPPVNYMKVVEPGRTGEENASYVVLGISYPRTYQAVAGDYEGDLVIPAYIDGLPVRAVNDAAFVECNKLKSVRFPATLRELGSRAFANCLTLTNVVFEQGLRAIGNAAFSNCVSLAAVNLPRSLSKLGAGCFQGCLQLTDVWFAGNAPRFVSQANGGKSALGESIFRQWGYYERFKVHINRNTYGWIAPYEKGVPEKWPTDCGFMQAHETVAEDGDPEAVEAGFVAVITEIKGNAVAVPETWTQRFPDYVRKFGSDFPASLLRPTGKKDGAGTALSVWQDYVAGTDPTDERDLFRATIALVDNKPVVSVLPALAEDEKAKRTYTIWGKRRLSDNRWTLVTEASETDCNFFKVTVEMSR